MNGTELVNNSKVLANSTDILKDLLQGDPKALLLLDGMELDTEAIKVALAFLTSDPSLSDSDKSSLIQDSWRINFRAKPPTPEEFLTEKYLGAVAPTVLPRIRGIFLDFLDPDSPYRNLILYPHIGFGKASYYHEKIYTPNGYILAKDIKVGDEVSTPNGKTAKVINTQDYPDEPIYKIVFEDNRSAFVGGNHNWKVCCNDSGEWRVLTTLELIERFDACDWYIPLQSNPVYHTEKKHSISPYEAGRKGKLTPEYLYDSIENRRDFLRGLMDEKGGVLCNTLIIRDYCPYSEDLIRSLGGIILGVKKRERILLFRIPEFQVFSDKEKQSQVSFLTETEDSLKIKEIVPTDLKGGKCIEIDDEDRLYLTGDYVVTHNSFLSTLINLYISVCVSLMRDPYKYFGLSPATLLSQMLISYSLKKSRELLLKPYDNMMSASPFFEKVPRIDAMNELRKEFKDKDTVDKLYYTTADKDSDFLFDSGLTIKTNSTVQGLLGLSLITVTYSELAFFTDAGKALSLNELVKTERGDIPMGDIIVGDKVLSPNGEYTEVIAIPWEGEDDLYEIELEDGRTVKCNLEHLWPVTYESEGIIHKEVVSTRFMFEHPEIGFNILEYDS